MSLDIGVCSFIGSSGMFASTCMKMQVCFEQCAFKKIRDIGRPQWRACKENTEALNLIICNPMEVTTLPESAEM